MELGEIEVTISSLEHFSYCPRQCGLISIERTFDENVYTIRGRLAHEAVDSGETTESPDERILRGIPLWSERLRLSGRADVVELRRDGPYPVEYKVGPPRGPHATIQLCAQALCLEEMLGQCVPRGALFHLATRRRVKVELTSALRNRTLEVIEGVRSLLASPDLPPAPNDARCARCSLIDSCMPSVTCANADVTAWDLELLGTDRAGSA